MKVYTVIGGVNGTGKSSLTGVLRTQLKNLGQIIDVDKLTAQGGLSPLEGGKEALRRMRQCLEKGVCFTQESTLSGFQTDKKDKARLTKLKVNLCMNCGACSYVCPAKRDLAAKHQLAKAMVLKK